MAPERYHAALILKRKMGCKRKIMDTDYLACLHPENVELVYSDPVQSISENGITTQSGSEVHAIILAAFRGLHIQSQMP